jgi:hypothetical protein
MTSSDFEKIISEIHKVLEGKNSIVEWNAKIPDPDNADQLRQIDVLIERDGKRTIIECRHHKRAQDVKWVEEIFGRKTSLRALSAIAVSSSGFTKGAVKKAHSLGVILRDFSELTIKEVASWGKMVKGELEFTKFENLHFHLIHSTPTIIPSTFMSNRFKDKDGNNYPLYPIFKTIAEKADEFIGIDPSFRLQLLPKNLYVRNTKINEMAVECTYKNFSQEAFLPIVETYGSPEKNPLEKEVKIEKSIDTMFQFYHTPKRCIPVIDISKVKVPRSSIFRRIKLTINAPSSGMLLVGLSSSISHEIPYKIHWLDKSSLKYKMFFK